MIKNSSFLLIFLLLISSSCNQNPQIPIIHQDQVSVESTSPYCNQTDSIHILNVLAELNTPVPFLNKQNAKGQKIGIWEWKHENGIIDQELQLLYDSLGQFAGRVFHLREGRFNWHHPAMRWFNETTLQVEKLKSISLDGMLSSVNIYPQEQKGLFLKVNGDYSSQKTFQNVHLSTTGKYLKLISITQLPIDTITSIPICKNVAHSINRNTYFNTFLGRLELFIPETLCADTSLSALSLNYQGKILQFRFGGNIQLAEYDADKDGKKELYIFSIFSCEGQLDIYKIYQLD